MSYEGYDIHLCALGHRWETDAYQDTGTCPYCDGAAIWSCQVDCTNGPGDEPDLEVLRKAKTEKCPECDHVKVIEPTRYKIPT